MYGDSNGLEETVVGHEQTMGGESRVIRMTVNPDLQRRRDAKIRTLSTCYSNGFVFLDEVSQRMRAFQPKGDKTWEDVPIESHSKNFDFDIELNALILNGNRDAVEKYFDCAFMIDRKRNMLYVAKNRHALPKL